MSDQEAQTSVGARAGVQASVIVPAHNEQAVIARLLNRLTEGDPHGELEIVVVPNGCTDETAQVARAAAPRARVVEIATASKIAALNAGDDAAVAFPRLYVDADTEVSAPALLALAGRLEGPEPAVGAPRMTVVTDEGASLLSRAYHRVWELTPYVRNGPIGCGVYGLNAAARSAFDTFPDVIADDLFVDRTAPGRRIIDEDHVFFFHAPTTTRALLARLTRATLGNYQLEQTLGLSAATAGRGGVVSEVLRRPALWACFPVYVVIRGLAALRARRALRAGRLEWLRDDSARSLGATASGPTTTFLSSPTTASTDSPAASPRTTQEDQR